MHTLPSDKWQQWWSIWRWVSIYVRSRTLRAPLSWGTHLPICCPCRSPSRRIRQCSQQWQPVPRWCVIPTLSFLMTRETLLSAEVRNRSSATTLASYLYSVYFSTFIRGQFDGLCPAARTFGVFQSKLWNPIRNKLQYHNFHISTACLSYYECCPPGAPPPHIYTRRSSGQHPPWRQQLLYVLPVPAVGRFSSSRGTEKILHHPLNFLDCERFTLGLQYWKCI